MTINFKEQILRRAEIDKARRVIQADNDRLYSEWWSAQKREGRTDEEIRALVDEAIKKPFEVEKRKIVPRPKRPSGKPPVTRSNACERRRAIRQQLLDWAVADRQEWRRSEQIFLSHQRRNRNSD